MKIVIASDSYKGSNTSMQVASLIEQGMSRVFPDARFLKIPVADGGEGTVDALIEGLDGELRNVSVDDPVGASIQASYGVVGSKAILEMAAASGLPLLAENKKNPMLTSSYGTGQLIVAALEAGYSDITIGIGGSATNDGGVGMAQAMGYRFLDADENELQRGGGALLKLKRIDDARVHPLLKTAAFHVACDVDNPLLGEQGASRVYGPQKGASPWMMNELDASLTVLADVTEKWKGRNMRNLHGAGAAGGLGFGLMAFCDAELKSGIDTVLDLVDFDSLISDASLVITGEGRIDGQSIRGKVPVGIAARTQRIGLPVLAIVGGIAKGASTVYSYGIDSIMCTLDRPMLLEDAISRSQECLVDAAERASRMIRIGLKMAKVPG